MCPQVAARALPQPRLQYGQNKCIDPGVKGGWQLINIPLLRPATIASAGLLSYVPRSRICNDHIGDNLVALAEVRIFLRLDDIVMF